VICLLLCEREGARHLQREREGGEILHATLTWFCSVLFWFLYQNSMARAFVSIPCHIIPHTIPNLIAIVKARAKPKPCGSDRAEKIKLFWEVLSFFPNLNPTFEDLI